MMSSEMFRRKETPHKESLLSLRGALESSNPILDGGMLFEQGVIDVRSMSCDPLEIEHSRNLYSQVVLLGAEIHALRPTSLGSRAGPPPPPFPLI